MHTSDVIIAAASGWGRSGRALVRMSGTDLLARVRAVIAVPPEGHGCVARVDVRMPARSSKFDSVGNGARVSLPCLAMRFDGPRSYTGEDILELVVPGSEIVLERVVAAFCELPGVREARPGEFSARAYLNGKMTLDQAEGVAALIAARSEQDLRAAESVLEGEAGARFRRWSEEAATLLALVEAGIDFTDQEDVVPISPAALATRLERMSGELDEALGARGGEEHRATRPSVVLAGAPNAGKSTLFNALLGRKRAVESPMAGTTRDVLAEPLDLSRDGGQDHDGADGVVTLIDLAGLDEQLEAASSIDVAAQRLAMEQIARADVIVHCDPAGRFLRLPVTLNAAARVIRVRTKADQTGMDARGGGDALAVCALDGWHLGALRRAIGDGAWGAPARGGEGSVVPRHRRTLTSARARLVGALEHVKRSQKEHALGAPELVAGELRLALDALGELTGAISPDEVIGRVFATFCVGK